MIPNLDLWTAVLPVADALEALEVPYPRGWLDRDYLRLWADRLGVTELLQRAVEEAGLK